MLPFFFNIKLSFQMKDTMYYKINMKKKKIHVFIRDKTIYNY